MAKPEKIRQLTVDEYLQLERTSKMRHEYVRGQIFAMSGATQAHNAICGNLYAALHNFLRKTGCRVYQSDMKVRIEAADSFYYPDIMVTCEPFDPESVLTRLPSLIIEVLSPSTKHIDRREKLVAYRQLSSLRQYILVHQQRILIEVFSRASDIEWELTMLRESDKISLEVLPDKPLITPVSAVYEEIVLPPYVKEPEEEYELSAAKISGNRAIPRI